MAPTQNRLLSEPMIFLTEEVKDKQDAIVDIVDTEVAWFGLIKVQEFMTGPFLVVYDLLIPEQEVSGGHVEWDGAMNPIIDKLVDDGREDEIQNLKFFAHSHATMSAFQSETDANQILDWQKLDYDWVISYIQNKRGETDVRFDQFKPFHLHVPKLKVRTLLKVREDGELRAELEKKLRKPRTWDDHTITTDFMRFFFGEGCFLRHEKGLIIGIKQGNRLVGENRRTGEIVFNDKFEEAMTAKQQYEDYVEAGETPWDQTDEDYDPLTVQSLGFIT